MKRGNKRPYGGFKSSKNTSRPRQDRQRSLENREFDGLRTVYSHERFRLESPEDLTSRVVDLVTPIGKGQRGLIVSPPRAGKTMLLQNLAQAFRRNSPDTEVFILLVDERPEEVTDLRRADVGEVVFSSFDSTDRDHIEIAETLLARAKELVVDDEKDVVILLDSITRLARAYNTTSRSTGKILSGGMGAEALYLPKKFFGAARAMERGGSLTILGTALVDTGSRQDDLIFEEFKGTGNMELHLERRLMEKRIFPTVDIKKSGTRKEELLYSELELAAMNRLRQELFPLDTVTAMETFLTHLKKTETNTEFCERFAH